MLTVKEAAEWLGLLERRVLTLAMNGRLTSYRDEANKLYFRERDLERYQKPYPNTPRNTPGRPPA